MNSNNKIIKKSNSDSVIPLNIYQTWHDKSNLPSSVENCISNIKTCNPLFTHHLYDQNECREFIKNNYKSAYCWKTEVIDKLKQNEGFITNISSGGINCVGIIKSNQNSTLKSKILQIYEDIYNLTIDIQSTARK